MFAVEALVTFDPARFRHEQGEDGRRKGSARVKHGAIATPSRDVTDGLPTPRRYYAAATVWLAISMSVLDSAIANIALPTIAA